jgi:lysine-ketoglutarate reductase/saccharopine dehydrogenase-like protein (TIGR00300 family)
VSESAANDTMASAPTAARETVELEGHIIDSLLLAKVLDLIVSAGADYSLVDVEIGRTATDVSRARLEIRAAGVAELATLLEALQVQGVNPVEVGEARLEAAPSDGVLPTGFYSTTNLPTAVHLGGAWREVANPEMDCALVANLDGTVVTCPMHRVRAGDLVVVGRGGVRVEIAAIRARPSFEFMNAAVSSEKPKALLVSDVAARIVAAHARGGKVLLVCGPAVVHTGAAVDVATLVREGHVDALFAGNGFATHDIESNVLGTSLGISLLEGSPTEGGHANHLRAINEIRRFGSIAAAVDAGYLAGGVMYECVRRTVPFVLAGSVRDDGPLPDVMSDVVQATDAMRALVPGVEVALILASTLHGIATGNLLPATVETICVDINAAVVTKLTDRGSHQAHGIVTDVGLFVADLAARLAAEPR